MPCMSICICYGQKFLGTWPSHPYVAYLLKLPFQMLSPFPVIITSSHLQSLSTRFWIYAHSATRAVGIPVHPKGDQWGWVQGLKVLPGSTWYTMELFNTVKGTCDAPECNDILYHIRIMCSHMGVMVTPGVHILLVIECMMRNIEYVNDITK